MEASRLGPAGGLTPPSLPVGLPLTQGTAPPVQSRLTEWQGCFLLAPGKGGPASSLSDPDPEDDPPNPYPRPPSLPWVFSSQQGQACSSAVSADQALSKPRRGTQRPQAPPRACPPQPLPPHPSSSHRPGPTAHTKGQGLPRPTREPIAGPRHAPLPAWARVLGLGPCPSSSSPPPCPPGPHTPLGPAQAPPITPDPSTDKSQPRGPCPRAHVVSACPHVSRGQGYWPEHGPELCPTDMGRRGRPRVRDLR